jgi:hypothetical protein
MQGSTTMVRTLSPAVRYLRPRGQRGQKARLEGGDEPQLKTRETVHSPQPISKIPTKRLSQVLAGISFSAAT